MNFKVVLISAAIIVLMIVTSLYQPYLLIFWLIALAIVQQKFTTIKGAIGEWSVNGILKKLDETDYHLYHDLYIPKEDGTTSQVDHIVTSRFGIFVIETKHYTGWIFGSERQRYWTQVIYKRKEKFLNPIWQNKGHIQAAKNYLSIEEDSYFHSIIAFSGNSTLKFEDNFKDAQVIQFHQLTTVIQEKQNVVLSDSELEAINRKLNELTKLSSSEKRKVKKDHVASIKNNRLGKNTTNQAKGAAQKKRQNEHLNEPSHSIEEAAATTEETITSIGEKTNANALTCPRCNKELTLRKGKYGSFYGCNNYPSCKYTQKTN
ncbi:MAG: NERD domain-containing protein [Bacillus sp. (in: Bacteria)]|nr:NERD domain-containing protein [Bacillus sp. (in: firmicutes)]